MIIQSQAGFIWTYPGKKLLNKSICVLPEKANYKKISCLVFVQILLRDINKND